MAFTGQLGTDDSYPGNLALGLSGSDCWVQGDPQWVDAGWVENMCAVVSPPPDSTEGHHAVRRVRRVRPVEEFVEDDELLVLV